MDHLPRVSEALYVGLCHYIGTPTDLEVTIRREVIDIDGKIRTPNGLIYMKSVVTKKVLDSNLQT